MIDRWIYALKLLKVSIKIAQFSKFCAKVMHFLHIRKKNVHIFKGNEKKNNKHPKRTTFFGR
jgi:hypothetical protein